MPRLRDIQLQQQARLRQKQDETFRLRAVLCDEQGNVSGTGSVWANQDLRLVWFLAQGGASPGQVPCYRLEPTIGLGVIIGVVPGSNRPEVLEDDPLLRQTNTSGTSYMAPNGRDFEPGGRLMMWVYSKVFVPLSVYPGTGLAVSVAPGDYEAADGTRKSFGGFIDFSIAASQPAGPNEHLLVGLYLDASNALQSVDGATVATGVTAPEPSWPADAIRLAVVDLDDSQTTVSFANDITDRRLYFSHPGSGAILKSILDAKGDLIVATAADTPARLAVGSDGTKLEADSSQAAGIRWARKGNYAAVADPTVNDDSGDGYEVWSVWLNTATPSAWVCLDASVGAANWQQLGSGGGYPFTIITVDATEPTADYTTLQAAQNAASAGNTIEVGSDLAAGAVISKQLFIVGVGWPLISDDVSEEVSIETTAAGTWLRHLRITGTYTGAATAALYIDTADNCVLSDLVLSVTAGTTRRGLWIYDSDVLLDNCRATATGGTTNYGLHVANLSTGKTVTVRGGRYEGGTAAINVDSGQTVKLEQLPVLVGGITGAGTVTGAYIDGATGTIVVVGTSDIKGVGSNYPDLGTTTAAEQIGNVYLGAGKDLYPGDDAAGLWFRDVNFGRSPAEHWAQGSDQLAWTGWAAYTGYVTPSGITRTGSTLSVTELTAPKRAFYYRPYTNALASILSACGSPLGGETGLMVDDGVDTGDGQGANNFVRVFIEWPVGTANANIASQYRSGGGAVTKATYLSFPPQDFVGLILLYGAGTRWTSWTAQVRIVGRRGKSFTIGNIVTGLTWTPARHGLYGYIAVAARYSDWDWFEEALGAT